MSAFLCVSPDIGLLSLSVPKRCESDKDTCRLQDIPTLAIQRKSENILKPIKNKPMFTEAVASELNVKPDVSSLSPAPWSFHLVQTLSILLVLLQEPFEH